MLTITEKVLQSIEQQNSKTLVGEICRIIEEIQIQALPLEESFSLVKRLLKNKIYESGRQRTALETKFSEGFTSFNVQFDKKE